MMSHGGYRRLEVALRRVTTVRIGSAARHWHISPLMLLLLLVMVMMRLLVRSHGTKVRNHIIGL